MTDSIEKKLDLLTREIVTMYAEMVKDGHDGNVFYCFNQKTHELQAVAIFAIENNEVTLQVRTPEEGNQAMLEAVESIHRQMSDPRSPSDVGLSTKIH